MQRVCAVDCADGPCFCRRIELPHSYKEYMGETLGPMLLFTFLLYFLCNRPRRSV